MLPFEELKRREQASNPIRAAVIGAGFFGAGVIRQLVHAPGIVPAIVANRTVQKAAEALIQAGVDERQIIQCQNKEQARKTLNRGEYVVTSELQLPLEVQEIDVVAETTGDILIGATLAYQSLEAKKHFVGANPETQATVGAILKAKANKAGVVYSDMDGDQPGILKKLYDYVGGIGFAPVVAGNCKGVMKRYATPETQAAYCRENPIKPWIATAAADGTKLNIEMCLVANATGMLPPKTGMTGVETTYDNVIADFIRHDLLSRGPIVDYTLGIPVGVFVIGHNKDAKIQEEMKYFKMGDGPYYFFFAPHVLCQFDAVPSIAEAVFYHYPTITPKEVPAAMVAAFAKQDLHSGKKPDGIGGFDCYGQIASLAESKDLLPVGLCEFTRLKRAVKKDEPLRWSDVELIEENFLTDLYLQQERMLEEKNILHPVS